MKTSRYTEAQIIAILRPKKTQLRKHSQVVDFSYCYNIPL